MKSCFVLAFLGLNLIPVAHASIIPCVTAPLVTYLNSGHTFDCTLDTGIIDIGFNGNLLPSYAGISLLAGDQGAATSAFTVVPGQLSLDFDGNFVDNSIPLSTQTELVQFMASTTTPSLDLASTTFHLNNATAAGGALGTAVVVGQELVCVGGSFTSLPTGLVTSVVNGVLGDGAFGCNGTALVGTAGLSSGPLAGITGVLDLPNLTGLTDTATIQLSPYNTQVVDVIKIQALVSLLGGNAATQGFGNNFTTQQAIPEPSASVLALAGFGMIFLIAGIIRKRPKANC